MIFDLDSNTIWMDMHQGTSCLI